MLGPRGFLRLRGAWAPGIAPRPGRSVLSLRVESSVWAHMQCRPSAEVRKRAVGLGLGPPQAFLPGGCCHVSPGALLIQPPNLTQEGTRIALAKTW